MPYFIDFYTKLSMVNKKIKINKTFISTTYLKKTAKKLYLYLLSISVMFLFGCKENKNKNTQIISSNLKSQIEIESIIKKYVIYQKEKKDTVKIIGLYPNRKKIAMVSLKSPSSIRKSFPSYFFFVDDILINVYSGTEELMILDSTTLKLYNYYAEKALTTKEELLYEPPVWLIKFENGVYKLDETADKDKAVIGTLLEIYESPPILFTPPSPNEQK